MILFLAALGVLLAGGLGAALAGRRAALATALGAGGALLGGGLGAAAALAGILERSSTTLSVGWGAPFGTIELNIDVLSAVFLLPTFLVPALAAIYGAGYLQHWRHTRSLGGAWFAYDVLVASMALVLAARGTLVFLVAWEVMALASFLLVTFEHERLEVRRAGWIYLVATHLGTAALLVFFLLLGGAGGDFRTPISGQGASAVLPGALFLLALVGFGTKAGLAPLHVWLPEAHPVAPSHVSAVMSGVMIETGIYGILRATLLLGPPPWWWGACLLGIGVVSTLVGVLLALAQQDLKRLLAYSSVEHVGIMAMGGGLGLLGVAGGNTLVALLGFSAALLHMLNHSLFKALLFLAAGAVKHATGTLALDRLGGLLRRMRDTGAVMLAGTLGAAALPPLNGFAGELLLFAAALAAAANAPLELAGPGTLVLITLGLAGALAAAAGVKAFGAVFLGQPRGPEALAAREVKSPMRVPMHLLAAGCVALGLFPALGLVLVARAAVVLADGAGPGMMVAVDAALGLARRAGYAALALLVLASLVALLRRLLLRGRSVGAADTWACGYEGAVPRAQYTGSSLVQPAVAFFKPVLTSTRPAVVPPTGFHPAAASFRADTPDVFRHGFWQPVFRRLAGWLERPRALQHGSTHLYLLYIFVTLLALLAYMRGWSR